MSDMIERVARAIWNRHEQRLPKRTQITWGQGSTFGHEQGLEDARAAIRAHEEALAVAGYVIVPREPTEAMRLAGANTVEKHPWFHTWQKESAGMWQAMIDAALGEEGDDER